MCNNNDCGYDYYDLGTIQVEQVFAFSSFLALQQAQVHPDVDLVDASVTPNTNPVVVVLELL
jgi:hypothetical protein